MTYTTTIRIDVEEEMTYPNPDADKENQDKFAVKAFTIPRVYMGKIPIMVQSDFCILKGLDSHARYYMGECRNDHGGYFIINGKEKAIVSHEHAEALQSIFQNL